MKKSLFVVFAALLAFVFASCATTSGATSESEKSSESSETASSEKTSSEEASKTAKQTALNALTGAGKNTWFKKTSKDGNIIYYILYSDTAVTSGVRSDVVINKGLTIVATSDKSADGLSENTFAVKSFGQTATESADGSSQTFTLNDGGWSYFYAKNSENMTALSSLPEQLKEENTSKYSILTSQNFNWKQILIDYLEGTL